MQLLWRGIAAYVFHYQIDLMFGCASLPGTDRTPRVELTYLYQNHLAPRGAAARPAASLRGDAPAAARGDRPQAGAGATAAADQRLPATRRLRRRRSSDRPPVQHHDVAVVVKTDLVTDKYYRHYERQLREALD